MKCQDKMPFPSREAAEDKARTMVRFGRKRFTVYACQSCGYWHMTSKKKGR